MSRQDPLPAGLAPPQRQLLTCLREWAARTGEVSWLTVGCSVARGNSDSLSDADVAIGVAEGAVGSVTAGLRSAADGLGTVVGTFESRLPEVSTDHARVFVQFEERVQLDAVVISHANARFPDALVLYDPEDEVDTRPVPGLQPGLADAGAWVAGALEALSNVEKYLRRDSLWEAQAQLEVARANYFRLVAYAAGLPDARFGITSIYDSEDPAGVIPAGMERTVAVMGREPIAAAARHLVGFLRGPIERYQGELPADHLRFWGYVRELLAAL